MRTSLTFILRLYLESDQPSIVRGTLQAVMEDRVEAFTDEEKLLEALHRMILEAINTPLPDEEPPNRSETTPHY